MTYLDWSRQSRTKIENVPSSVTVFNCNNNKIRKIENIPPSVTRFTCTRNQIQKIENIPPSVTVFNCSGNQITRIENVPPSVTIFHCNSNQIQKIENLPPALGHFNYCGNPITHVDDLPIEWWNQRGGFRIKSYGLIKRLQRRMRIRLMIKHKKARIIQKACHNWLWKTECRDGTMGIVLKLSLKELTQAGLIKD